MQAGVSTILLITGPRISLHFLFDLDILFLRLFTAKTILIHLFSLPYAVNEVRRIAQMKFGPSESHNEPSFSTKHFAFRKHSCSVCRIPVVFPEIIGQTPPILVDKLENVRLNLRLTL